jgi:hypothetical protein
LNQPPLSIEDLHNQKHHPGAFFAPQKTGLSGGSAACAAAPRPSNPLRTSPHPFGESMFLRKAGTKGPQITLIMD